MVITAVLTETVCDMQTSDMKRDPTVDTFPMFSSCILIKRLLQYCKCTNLQMLMGDRGRTMLHLK